MTSRLVISKTVQLPLEAVTSTFGLLAMRGAGKSNAAAAMAEEMFKARLPFVVVDPVSAWWGLRSGPDGNPKTGLPIPIFGGRRGDVPLEKGSGQLLADLIVDKRLSCVLDLSGFTSEADKKSFLLDFARRIYQRNEDPLHLFLEEADDYIPQDPMRDETHLLRAWENIVRRGRARGLGITLITQRSAVLNKKVLTQVETLFVLRTTGPQDIRAVKAWVQYHQVDEDLLASLAGLEDGEAWVWSPHFLKRVERFRFRRRSTYDSGATPANLRGKDHKPAATLADVDLALLREKMAQAIDRAKADDPKELRRRIAELEKRVHELESAPPASGVDAQDLAKLQAAARQLVQATSPLEQLAADVELAVAKVVSAASRPRSSPARAAPPSAPRRPPEAPRSTTRPAPATRPSPDEHQGGANHSLAGGQRKILTALAQYPEGRSDIQVAILTRYASTGGGFRNYIGALRSAGYIEGHNDWLRITRPGVEALGPFEPLPTGAALLEHWRGRLSKAERLALEAIAEAYPQALSIDQVAERTGYQPDGGGFRNAIGKLRTLELLRGRNDELRAADELFQ